MLITQDLSGSSHEEAMRGKSKHLPRPGLAQRQSCARLTPPGSGDATATACSPSNFDTVISMTWCASI